MAANDTQELADNSMLDLFRAEVETHTQTLNEGLLTLEKAPNQLKQIEPLMRAAHSIKGAARIVGVEDGVRISHVMEDCLVAAQNGQITLTSESIDILLRGVDALSRIAGPDQAGPDQAELDKLLQEIGTIRQGETRSAKKLEPAAPGPSPAVSHPAIAVVLDGPSRTIGIPGNLDSATVERLRQTLLVQLDTGGRHFRIDLGCVREIDVAGLALLDLFARTTHREERTTLELVNVGPDLATLFQATGLEGLYLLKTIGS
jgi:two-component system sensor histidine kinase and response regulator WspE